MTRHDGVASAQYKTERGASGGRRSRRGLRLEAAEFGLQQLLESRLRGGSNVGLRLLGLNLDWRFNFHCPA